MDLSLAPYHWAVTLLGGGENGRRRLSNLVNLAAQSVAVAFFVPMLMLSLNPLYGRRVIYIPPSTLLFMILVGPFLAFPLLFVLRALVLVLSGSLNYALDHQHEEERRRTYLILSWIAAFGLAILLSVLLCFLD
jgi:hypothetical protein